MEGGKGAGLCSIGLPKSERSQKGVSVRAKSNIKYLFACMLLFGNLFMAERDRAWPGRRERDRERSTERDGDRHVVPQFVHIKMQKP